MTRQEIKEMILNDWAELLMNAKSSVIDWLNNSDHVEYDTETLSHIKSITEKAIKTGDPIIIEMNKGVIPGVETAFNIMVSVYKAGLPGIGSVKEELTSLYTSYFDSIPEAARESIAYFEI